MKMLIDAAEIAALLPTGNYDMIPQTAILAAQSRYIKPVLGDALYAAVEAGKYADLTEQLLKPALALYAYYLAIPSIAFRSGMLGVVRFKSDYFTPADRESLRQLRRSVRTEADCAMEALVQHLEADPALFPEYARAKNIRHRTSIIGGIVL